MNILFLDDDQTRHNYIKKLVPIEHYVCHVYTASECIEMLETKNWDMVFLDHDLGGQVFVDSGEGTGYQVAEWLEQNPERQPAKMFIHSFNPVGARNMHNCIPKAIIKPISIVYQEFGEIINS